LKRSSTASDNLGGRYRITRQGDRTSKSETLIPLPKFRRGKNIPRARLAVLSVSNRAGIADFARGLVASGWALLATDGTAKHLSASGVAVRTISDYTGQPELLGGRVKTLHPRVFAGILAAEDDASELQAQGIELVDLVAANLYAFPEAVARPGVTPRDAMASVDIGGAALVRAAAKNAERVTVVVRPERYPEVLQAIRDGGVSPALRAALALEAFEYTSGYDAAIYDYLWDRRRDPLPGALRLALPKAMDLRYGENPYQRAALYAAPAASGRTLARADQLQGKELSYNNLLDLDAALRLAHEFDRPAAAVIKHTNPSGCAVADTVADAYRRAHDADPAAAYGCVVGLNRTVDASTATAMKGHFVEAVVAPDYEPGAIERLRSKKNLRVLRASPSPDGDLEIVRVSGGVLVQTSGPLDVDPRSWKAVTTRAPTAEQLRDMAFGVRVSRYVKSNSIVLAHGERTVGVGAGQMTRVDACMLARVKAGPKADDSVAVSDAFFPFRDGIDELARGGVAAIAQPGGSIRDAEVIAATEEHGIAMVFTGLRLFRH